MKKYIAVFVVALIACQNGWADGFLRVAPFPKTFNDLSFGEQVRILEESYEPYESVFDERGVCIENCAYPGITLKDIEEQSEQNAKDAWDYMWSDAWWDEGKILADKIAQEEKLAAESEQYYDSDYLYDDNYYQYPNYQYPKSAGESGTNFNPMNGMPFGLPFNLRKALQNQEKIWVSSCYGPRDLNRNGKIEPHHGIDFALNNGTPVWATANGTVVFAGLKGGYGKTVEIKHPSGVYTLYAHLNDISVQKNQNVKLHQVIGHSGNTGGRSTGYHLHYGMYNKRTKNPYAFFNPVKYLGSEWNQLSITGSNCKK